MIDFLKYIRIYALISATLLASAIIGLLMFGLRPSIDFTGGSLLEYELNQKLSLSQIEATLTLSDQFDQILTTDSGLIIRTGVIEPSQVDRINTDLVEAGLEPVQTRYETVGPVLGAELLRKTIIGIVLGTVLIMAYVAYQFRELNYGLAAVMAMAHDVLVVVGAFAWFGYWFNVEVDALFVTAVLTTLSFSIHDTIVVFDRIREKLSLGNQISDQLINEALNETMSRSVNNSLTIIFMLLALVLLGGSTIRWFIVALLLGTILGTYSSPFVATPLLRWWHQRRG